MTSIEETGASSNASSDLSTMLKTRRVSELTHAEYKAFARLTLGNAGTMRDWLLDLKNSLTPYKRNGEIFYIEKQGKILAWCLLAEYKPSHARKWRKVVQVYVRAKCRRRGFAKFLIEHARATVDGEKLFCTGNGAFFNPMKIRYCS